MYQLIKCTPGEGITIRENLSLSALQKLMNEEYEEVMAKKGVIMSELFNLSASIYTGAEKYYWKINQVFSRIPVRGGHLVAKEIADPDYPGITTEFAPESREADFPLSLVEQNNGILRSVVYTKMYEEDPVYNESFDYDSEMIKTLCYSSYLQDDTIKPGKKLSYKDFCNSVFTDKKYIKKILSMEESEIYRNYVQMLENGYI